jgi:CheY-like chemotaxis protein
MARSGTHLFQGWQLKMHESRPATVLYVEDESLILDVMSLSLEDAGFQVVTAENGAAALDALDDDPDAFCALVTDINLGRGPDGWEVAKHARALKHDLPVVYVSGASGHEWTRRGVPNSVLVAKPFTPTRLVNALASLLTGNFASCLTW